MLKFQKHGAGPLSIVEGADEEETRQKAGVGELMCSFIKFSFEYKLGVL
jgi:benzoyl-CoA reductase/2-hydroxyglutaryl-CoA dehydratase subunit BcrC/BadD/HgdB